MAQNSRNNIPKITHILLGIIVAFALRLIFLGNSISSLQQQNENDRLQSQHRRQRIPVPELDEYLQKTLSGKLQEYSTSIGSAMNNSSIDKINLSSSAELVSTPAWIHKGLMLIINSEDDFGKSVEKPLSEKIENFLSLDFEKNNINSIILRSTSWQDPMNWGQPNPQIFFSSSSSSSSPDTETIDHFSNFVEKMKSKFNIKVLVELSSFLPRTSKNGRTLRRSRFDPETANAISEKEFNFVGETGYRDKKKHHYEQNYFRVLEVERKVRSSTFADDDATDGVLRQNGRLLNFNSSRVRKWTTRQILPLLEAGVSGFLVDCAEDVLETAHQHDDFFATRDEMNWKNFRHVTAKSYAKECHRWFYDTGRMLKTIMMMNNNNSNPESHKNDKNENEDDENDFVTGAVIMRKNPFTNLYSNENPFGGSSSVAVESCSFALVEEVPVLDVRSNSSSSESSNFHFLSDLRESFLAVSHAFYSGVAVLGVIPPSSMKLSLSQKFDDCELTTRIKRWIQFSAMLPIFVTDIEMFKVILDNQNNFNSAAFHVLRNHHQRTTQSRVTTLSRLLHADHIISVPDHFSKHDTEGPDLFEQHIPSQITMWPANPHRIQIFEPLFWQMFVGADRDFLVAPVVYDFMFEEANKRKKLVYFPGCSGNNSINKKRPKNDAEKDCFWLFVGDERKVKFPPKTVVEFDIPSADTVFIFVNSKVMGEHNVNHHGGGLPSNNFTG